MLDILDMINDWIASDRRVALATVVKTWGSAPRREGSKMGITAEMGRAGTRRHSPRRHGTAGDDRLGQRRLCGGRGG